MVLIYHSLHKSINKNAVTLPVYENNPSWQKNVMEILDRACWYQTLTDTNWKQQYLEWLQSSDSLVKSCDGVLFLWLTAVGAWGSIYLSPNTLVAISA